MYKIKTKPLTKQGAFILGIAWTVFTAVSWYQFVHQSKAYFAPLMERKQQIIVEEKVVEIEQDPLMAERIIQICKENGLTKDEDIKWILGKLWNESRWKQYALNNNGANGIDRGIAQINSKYHPEISNECAFDITCSVKFMVDHRKDGKDIWYASDKL